MTDNTVILVPMTEEEIQFTSILMVDRMLELRHTPSKSLDVNYDIEILHTIVGKMTDRLKAIDGGTRKK